MRDTRKELLTYWFDDIDPKQWFQRNEMFDQEVTERFLSSYKIAMHGWCDSWRDDAQGCVALCLLLDHIPRIIFRGTPRAFASDEKALLIAKYAISKSYDEVVENAKKRFIYQPFLHSENLQDQRQSVALFAKSRDRDPVSYDHACRRMDVIGKYGRFPQRNAILGRVNTQEEDLYLL